MVSLLEEDLEVGLDVECLVSEEMEVEAVGHDKVVESWWFGKGVFERLNVLSQI